jgi:peptidyl-prolyl cis-trans isomerase C
MVMNLGDAVMPVSHSPFRPGRILVALLCLGMGLAAVRPASGQIEPKSAPSPVVPGDLSKPAFDTKTPVYDGVTSLDKAASTVVAEIEGRPITLGDVGDVIRLLPPSVEQLPFDSLYPGILDQLIKQEALVVRAQQRGLDEDPTIRRRVKAAADRTLSEEYLRIEVSKGITEAALLDRYNRDIAGRPGPEEVRIRVILVGTEKEAGDLIAEIHGGADFATVARRASKDTSAVAGGELGFHARDDMNTQVAAVAFVLPVGQVTPNPVRTSAGWFVIKVEERRQGPAPNFVFVREQLRQTLLKEGVASLAETALRGLQVRRYNITGKEVGITGDELAPDRLGAH